MKSTKTIPDSSSQTYTTRDRDLAAATQFLDRNESKNAYAIANKYLLEDPNDIHFLHVFVGAHIAQEYKVLGYHLAKRATEIAPKRSSCWTNFGMACQDLWRSKEAERAYRRGLKVAVDDDDRYFLLINLCAVMIDTGRFDEAEPFARQALKLRPDSVKAMSNISFCQLARRDWSGWKYYRQCLGTEWRPRYSYSDESEYEGQPLSQEITLALYSEQGLGDVLSFASMIPDVSKDCKVIFEVESRLENLMRRSFPDVKVYGTRDKKGLNWDKEDQVIDYSLPVGQMAEYYRTSDDDFPGTPYLVPDPDRVTMWKALFEKKQKPVIGIAWRGGVPKTGAKFRQWDLEQLLPILKSVDAHWVSLQYKPAGDEIAEFRKKHHIDIVEYPHATLTNDYDDTAGLVACLDQVVCIHTAVGHLAGALGVPCWTFVPQNSQWRYGQDVEDMVWYHSVRLIRQTKRGEWADDIQRVAKELHAHYAGVSKTTGKTAQQGKLRSHGPKIRTNGGGTYRHDGDRPPA